MSSNRKYSIWRFNDEYTFTLQFPSFIHTQKRNPKTNLKVSLWCTSCQCKLKLFWPSCLQYNIYWTFLTACKKDLSCSQITCCRIGIVLQVTWKGQELNLKQHVKDVCCLRFTLVHWRSLFNLPRINAGPLWLTHPICRKLPSTTWENLHWLLTMFYKKHFLPLAKQDADMFWDFITLRPETTHQVSFLFSDRGTPDGYRHMNGYGSHTFKMVNAQGEAVYCKFHCKVVCLNCTVFASISSIKQIKSLTRSF